MDVSKSNNLDIATSWTVIAVYTWTFVSGEILLRKYSEHLLAQNMDASKCTNVYMAGSWTVIAVYKWTTVAVCMRGNTAP